MLLTAGMCFSLTLFVANHGAAGSVLMQYQVRAKEEGKEIKFIELSLASEVRTFTVLANTQHSFLWCLSIGLLLGTHTYLQLNIASLGGAEILSFLLLPMTAKAIASPASAQPANAPKKPPASLTCLILSSTGLLSLLDTYKAEPVPLTSNVEQFWFGGDSLALDVSRGRANGASRVGSLHGSTIWTYGQAGMQVWFPLEGETPQKLQRKDRSLEFDTEVYPVGFVPELGLIVGVTQGVSYAVLPDSPCFELRTKARTCFCLSSFAICLISTRRHIRLCTRFYVTT